MPQLFVPLSGAFQKAAGSGYNTYGESLDRPLWCGAELNALDTFPDVWGGVSESEFHDWIIGVHHPLFLQNGPKWCRFLDPDPAVREEALSIAAEAAEQAHHVGARYILFHFPWPSLQEPGVDHAAQGWGPKTELIPAAAWDDEAALYEASRRVFAHLAKVQEKELIKIVLEPDGPNRHFFEGDLFTRLFTEFPELSLCLDTGRIGLLARTHGQDPLELTRRWLPWTRYMHLHTSRWDEDGNYQSHIPTDASHTYDRWPAVTPAADMARMVAEAQPRCIIVLEHDPRAVSPAELEAAHAFAATLVAR